MNITQDFINTLTRFETDLLKAFLDVRNNNNDDNLPEIDQPLIEKECIYRGSLKINRNMCENIAFLYFCWKEK